MVENGGSCAKEAGTPLSWCLLQVALPRLDNKTVRRQHQNTIRSTGAAQEVSSSHMRRTGKGVPCPGPRAASFSLRRRAVAAPHLHVDMDLQEHT